MDNKKYFTGDDLLEALLNLSKEDRKKAIFQEGCDCYQRWNGILEVYEEDIILPRLI